MLTATHGSAPGGGASDHGHTAVGDGGILTTYGRLADAETVSALWTFGAGLQLAAAQGIKDSGGTDRIVLATSSPHLTVTGQSQFSDQISIGEAPSGNRGLNVAPTFGTVTANVAVARVQPAAAAIGANSLQYDAVQGVPQVNLGASRTGTVVNALNFVLALTAGSGSTATRVTAVDVGVLQSVVTGTITTQRGVRVLAPVIAGGTPTTTTHIGVDIEQQGHSTFGTAFGLRIANITAGTTRRLLEVLGLSSTNLRVDAGDPPNAALTTEGDTDVWMACMENGTVTLRQLRWRAFASLGATDKVAIYG